MSLSSLTGALSIDQFCTDNAISKATASRRPPASAALLAARSHRGR